MGHVIHVDELGFEVTFIGHLNADESVAAMVDAHARIDLDRVRYRVVNFLPVEEYDFDPAYAATFRKLDEVMMEGRAPFRIAFVGVRTEALAIFQTYVASGSAGNLEVETFEELTPARAWAKGRSHQPKGERSLAP